MRTHRFPVSLAVIAAFSILVLAASDASAQAAAKVAIANPVRIFNEIQKTKDVRSQMDAETKNLENERLTREGSLRDIKAKRDLLNAGAPDFQKLNEDLMNKTIEFQAWMQVHQADLQHKQKMQIKVFFDEITAAVGKVAESRGIDLVIAEVKPVLPDNIDDIQVNQLQAILTTRNILYGKDTIDLSSAVIAAMDADYKAGK